MANPYPATFIDQNNEGRLVGELDFTDPANQPVPPVLMLHSGVFATTVGFPTASGNTPIVGVTDHLDALASDYAFYSITGLQQALTVSIANTATEFFIAYFYLIGSGDLPVIPPQLQTLVAGWGANPADVWDMTYSNVVLQALTGVDAGKSVEVGLDQSVPHPATDFIDPPDFHNTWQVIAGNLGVTIGIGGQANRIYLPSVGTYTAVAKPFIDFFYP